MKKISRTVAMVLFLVMLASSFTSCFTIQAFKEGNYTDVPIAILLDIALIILLGMGIPMLFDGVGESEAPETGIYLANAGHNPFSEYYFLRDKMYALPEMASAMGRLNALSETERSSLTDKLYYLPETEFASSVKRLNALSEAELSSVMRAFGSLSEKELDSLIEKLDERLNSSPIPENVALDYNFEALPEMAVVSLGVQLERL
jgi:hypothetical protein